MCDIFLSPFFLFFIIVIALSVFGILGILKLHRKFYATAIQDGGNIIVTYQGGPDHNKVQYFNITSVGSNTINLPKSKLNPSAGYFVVFPNHGTSSNSDTVIASARFKDGTEQIILHTKV